MFIPIYNLAGFTNNKDIPKIAKVINNSDPKGLGRIKVSLKGMFDPTDDTGTNLPWIRRMSSDMGIGTEEMNVPPVGTSVELIWPYDNRHAFYRGVPFGDSSLIGSFTNHDWGWSTSSGFALMMQKSTGNFVIKTKAVSITGDAEGNITIYTEKDLTENIDGNKITTIKGDDTNTITGSQTNNINTNIVNSAGGTISNTATGALTEQGATVTISAGGAITISGGSVTISGNTKIDGVTFLSHTHSNGHEGSPTGGVIS